MAQQETAFWLQEPEWIRDAAHIAPDESQKPEEPTEVVDPFFHEVTEDPPQLLEEEWEMWLDEVIGLQPGDDRDEVELEKDKFYFDPEIDLTGWEDGINFYSIDMQISPVLSHDLLMFLLRYHATEYPRGPEYEYLARRFLRCVPTTREEFTAAAYREIERLEEQRLRFLELSSRMNGPHSIEYRHFVSESRGWGWVTEEQLVQLPDGTMGTELKRVWKQLPRDPREIELVIIDGVTYTLDEDRVVRSNAGRTPLDKKGQELFPYDPDMWSESAIIDYAKALAREQELLRHEQMVRRYSS